ncbi:hypothetical protein K458DRAFT_317747 [Lentithecium fluviatile CBS 122367]|uniref:PH domain-containing protein n=1 Tax=Lentithecium fluviatile CBS 122367 TaxID=1168545 RepID=A0A6G1IJJ0_9PLEO|nr:hypothetical protein K458DRAFT_317747 [Lentithecium fluviatile CBS 122367]
MATTANPPPGAYAVEDHNGSDPFVTSAQDAHRQRYAAFDNSQFSLYLNGSPAQARRALQAHLAETTRRLQETSHLGNSLVQQRKELEERLKEVEKQEEDTDIGPELRSKLAEIEKEFNEVGRETARVFLPKSRVPSGETDATAGASVYTSEAQHSPSKISVPSRKQRNQQPSRINDIALATEISTSLLAQLKDLQAVLLEKDDALKAANLDRSQLEIEVEGLSQRLRTLDESESRLKDVNWNLETQVREFEAQSKVAADKEQRLNHNVNLAKSEKATLEREFEELKQLYAKLNEDHVTRTKQHETELSGLRRNVSMGETERGALQRKVDELSTQNIELAKAVQYRLRADEQASAEDTSPEEGAEEGDTATPDHSPPPSPTKATPRHGQLESETLKHSLHHAHRMIQQLKNNIHREKTEKIELKRMLQDARDELESSRNSSNGPGSASKRKKNDKDIFKKPARPDRLGALRTGSQEVMMDDDEWEEQEGAPGTPSRRPRQTETVPGAFPGGFSSAAESSAAEGFETANETSDAAFETANERDGTTTETDAFQTGAETLDGDSSDDLTETEAGPTTSTVRQRPSSFATASHRDSYESTASTSGDEPDNDADLRTPVQPHQPRYRLKLRQGGYRRTTPRGSQEIFAGTPPAVKDSPASFVNSNNSTPVQGQSLFAELGDLSAGESEDGSVADGTPSRSSALSPESSPDVSRKPTLGRSPLQSIVLSKPPMVDSSMMTEPWESVPAAASMAEPSPPMELSIISAQNTMPKSAPAQPLRLASLATQGTTPLSPPMPSLSLATPVAQDTEPQAAPPPSLHLSTHSVQDTVPHFIPPPSLNMATVSAQDTTPQSPPPHAFNMSAVISQRTEPHSPSRPSLARSSFSTQGTEPVSPVVERTLPPRLNISSIAGQATEPVELHATRGFAVAPVHDSDVFSETTEPREISTGTQESRHVPLNLSHLASQDTVPEEPPRLPPLSMSGLCAQTTDPVDWPRPVAPQLSKHSYQATEPVEQPRSTPPQFSLISYQATEPVASRPPQSQFSALSSQATDPVQLPKPATPQLSAVSYQTTSPVEPHMPTLPRVSAITAQHTEPVEAPVRPLPVHRLSDFTVLHDTQPESPTIPAFLPSPSRPSTATRIPPAELSVSAIMSQETEPDVPSRPTTAHRTGPIPFPVFAPGSQEEASQSRQLDKTENGYFASWGKANPEGASRDATSVNGGEGRVPLAPIASNAVQKERGLNDDRTSPVKRAKIPMADEGTQTMVSADQIDRLLLSRHQRYSGTIATAGVEKRMSPPASPSRRNSNEPVRAPRRPGSSSSVRSQKANLPPLPADHKQVIAAAALKSPTPLPAPASPGTMGPPAMPASAYKKRPQTPSIKTSNLATSPKTGGTTPRPRHNSQTRSGATSPITRRSSVSSFGSEIDHRFNIPGGPSFSDTGLDPRTDPRMIQAITQTMIGEFLWKYTRRAGREGMSENRHRRFFWVHPYTRTLYWSEQDPAAAGRSQLKAKSVAIEAVHQVTDDNPYPPGLHQKSLVVVTPGRTVKFTATTSQRHETWFNALHYLLKRTGEGDEDQKTETDEIQNEFNGGHRSTSRQTGRSRASYTSYASRRTSSPHHAQIPTLRQSTVTPNRPTSTEPTQGSTTGRWGSMLRSRSGLRASMSSRFSKTSAHESITYEEPNNSAADLSREMMESHARDQDRAEMEDVRACCDGKHSVAHLHQHSIKGRHGSYNTTKSRPSLIGSMSSRSHSRAESYGRDGQLSHQIELEAQHSGAG